MATRGVVRSERFGRSYSLTWEGLLSGDDGQAASIPGASDKAVHVFGTFGGTSVAMEGSNEVTPSNWAALHDANGDAIAISALGAEVIVENMRHIRPNLTGGNGTTDISVIVLAKSTAS